MTGVDLCENMIAGICNARSHAKTLQLMDREEMCKRPCCIGCEDRCGYADEIKRFLQEDDGR